MAAGAQDGADVAR